MGPNSYVCRSYRGKTGRGVEGGGGFLSPLILNRVKFEYLGVALKYKICSKCIWSETWILFLVLNNIHFLWAFGKSLRNNAPPTILSSTLVFPAISPTLLTLVRHPHWRITNLSHADKPLMSPTLVCHPRHTRW